MGGFTNPNVCLLEISDGFRSKVFDPDRGWVNFLWLASAIYGLGLNFKNFP